MCVCICHAIWVSYIPNHVIYMNGWMTYFSRKHSLSLLTKLPPLSLPFTKSTMSSSSTSYWEYAINAGLIVAAGFLIKKLLSPGPNLTPSPKKRKGKNLHIHMHTCTHKHTQTHTHTYTHTYIDIYKHLHLFFHLSTPLKGFIDDNSIYFISHLINISIYWGSIIIYHSFRASSADVFPG